MKHIIESKELKAETYLHNLKVEPVILNIVPRYNKFTENLIESISKNQIR